MLSWQVDTLRLDLDGLRASLKKSEDEKKVAVSGAIRRRRRSPQGAAEIAAPEDDDQVVVPEQCPAAQDREGRAEPDRDIGNRACEAALDRGGAVETALRAQERAAGQGALGDASAASNAARPATAAPSYAAPGKASSGTSSSPATTTSDTRPWSAPRCATPSMTETAGRSPCSASLPPRGSSPRADNFIGWTPEMREKNLHLVVDNPRFLILPWIEIPNLGSHILALVRRRLASHRLQLVLARSDADDVVIVIDEGLGHGLSDAARGTRDDGRFPLPPTRIAPFSGLRGGDEPRLSPALGVSTDRYTQRSVF